MRLIDADDLVNEFLNVCRTEFEVKNKCMADENVLHLIHNAPTVCADNYSMGYQDGVKKVLSERPQGEWLEVKEEVYYDYWTVCECSLCKHSWALGELSIEDIKDDYNFCPNCGADMRGGRE